MNDNLRILDVEINNLKETLYLLMKTSSLTDEVVVKCSEKLDRLILQYQKENKFS
ncbi:aspartyl-phosphate phosphatase Spo0E family protein [Clostridium autoethanogenum]|uniref:Aspartyl-phosphate phosphatase Spo0E family protein n=1 Tax=Clostridium autoethanogenum TaxID=84023 RepID=A0A3M0SM07_9CLOT|nr:aspartyl-phosphate phosphatase Spo0E family protein [Clostridium autoethanogenum]RMC99526.1 aspartyl-phosphate phosphatase Spo0E family protein [Clostridium autoethanogenum]